MSYVYASTLHPTGDAALAHCTHDYLTAGGLNNDATVRGFLADATDENLADDMIKNFGLDQPRTADEFGHEYLLDEGEEAPTTLEEWETDRAGVVRAMRDLRDEILSTPVEAAEEQDGAD